MACNDGGCISSSSTMVKDDIVRPGSGQYLTVIIKPMKGEQFEVSLLGSESIETLKSKIEESSKIASAEQRLTLRGKRIEEGTLDSNQIKNKTTLLLRQVPSTVSSSSSSSSSSSNSMGSTSSTSTSSPTRIFCLGGCSFYGDPAKDNLCSRCYDERDRKKKEDEEEKKKAMQKVKEEEEAKRAAEREANRPKQTKPTRCFKCNARVGPAIIHCRCGYGFCATCRYPEQHDCQYDFKTHDKEKLKVQAVRGDKMKDRT